MNLSFSNFKMALLKKNENTISKRVYMNSEKVKLTERHPFHLVKESPWPIYFSWSLFLLVLSFAFKFHGIIHGFIFELFFYLSIFLLITILICWATDINTEATFEGCHTNKVQLGLKIGMILFIVSEVMFFFAFFWAFFHSALAPTIEVATMWPPIGLKDKMISPWGIPLINTIILLSSGVTVTWSHHAVISGKKIDSILGLIFTITLGMIFTFFQLYEYCNSENMLKISTSVAGSLFYMLTGFHGFHVIIGTCFLSYNLYRLWFNYLTKEQHFGFEAAIWYWHFVDVVWLFVFIIIYWWGGM